jgi:Protein of unknown function (DUF2934)
MSAGFEVTGRSANAVPEVDRLRGEIERLAHYFWVQRGRPFGSPEVDWFRAEDEVRKWESPVTLPFSGFHMGPDTR